MVHVFFHTPGRMRPSYWPPSLALCGWAQPRIPANVLRTASGFLQEPLVKKIKTTPIIIGHWSKKQPKSWSTCSSWCLPLQTLPVLRGTQKIQKVMFRVGDKHAIVMGWLLDHLLQFQRWCWWRWMGMGWSWRLPGQSPNAQILRRPHEQTLYQCMFACMQKANINYPAGGKPR